MPKRRHPKLPSFTSGNAISLHRGGDEAFSAMERAIESAESSIFFETYILMPDETGWWVAELLAKAVRRGVEVSLIFDSFGSYSLTEGYLDFLTREGVRWLEFHPVAFWRKHWNVWHRLHRKTVIVDGRVAFIGGMNIANDYGPARFGGTWRDVMAEVAGPVVRQFSDLFQTTWFRQGGEPSEPAQVQGFSGSQPGEVEARLIFNDYRRKRLLIRREYIHAIRRARQRICLANAYFLPGPPTVRALVHAVRRGVKVDVIVPGNSDVKAVQWAFNRLAPQLIKGGVRLWAYGPEVFHSKTAVIDGNECFIGSYNFDAWSLRNNLESTLHVREEGFGREMEALFEEDCQRVQPLSLDRLARRGPVKKCRDWFFYRMRYYL